MSGAETIITAEPPATVTAPPNGTDWTASLTPELKAVVDAKGFKAPSDILTAYTNVEKVVGVDRIPLPKDGVWDEFAREKLGIPKEAAGYKIEKPKLPDGVVWDEGLEKAALPVFHKLGMTPAQVSGLVELFAGHQSGLHKTVSEAQAAAAVDATAKAEADVKALKGEWGSAYDQKLTFASRAVQHLGGEALVNVMNETGLGNNPEVVKAFAKVGEMLGEDTLKVGKGSGAMTPAEAMAEVSKIEADPAFLDRRAPGRDLLLKRRSELMAMAYPGLAESGNEIIIRA